MAGATLSPGREAWIDGRLAAFGDWLRRHGGVLRGIQWAVVGVYVVLVAVPVSVLPVTV